MGLRKRLINNFVFRLGPVLLVLIIIIIIRVIIIIKVKYLHIKCMLIQEANFSCNTIYPWRCTLDSISVNVSFMELYTGLYTSQSLIRSVYTGLYTSHSLIRGVVHWTLYQSKSHSFRCTLDFIPVKVSFVRCRLVFIPVKVSFG